MNKSKIVSIIAYLMIVAGAIAILFSINPSSSTKEIELPGDAGVYYYMSVAPQLYGHVSGSFEAEVESVNFYVLSPDQYEAYSYDLDPGDSLYSYTGITGNFSVDLPETSKYYICVDHGMSAGAAQTVTVHLKISGISLTFFVVGVIVLVVGVVLAVIGMRMKKKEKAVAPAPPPPEAQPTDVTMFDTKRRP